MAQRGDGMKRFILSAISVLSVLVFIVSLCAIGSLHPLPIITLFASEAWIIGYILRERGGEEDVDG